MDRSAEHRRLIGSAVYSIQVEGHLQSNWSDWFGGLTITRTHDSKGNPVTVLTGQLTDQSMLHGILAKIRDLGMSLIKVSREESSETGDRREQ